MPCVFCSKQSKAALKIHPIKNKCRYLITQYCGICLKVNEHLCALCSAWNNEKYICEYNNKIVKVNLCDQCISFTKEKLNLKHQTTEFYEYTESGE